MSMSWSLLRPALAHKAAHSSRSAERLTRQSIARVPGELSLSLSLSISYLSLSLCLSLVVTASASPIL